MIGFEFGTSRSRITCRFFLLGIDVRAAAEMGGGFELCRVLEERKRVLEETLKTHACASRPVCSVPMRTRALLLTSHGSPTLPPPPHQPFTGAGREGCG